MAIKIPFRFEYDCEYGKIQQITPLIRRIVAQNPNPFTFFGTNTYILGHGEVAVIDPGPDLDQHLTAIDEGLQDETITHVLITHDHLDHWPACRRLRTGDGAKTYGFHPSGTGNPAPNPGASHNPSNFVPQVGVSQGDVIQGKDWSVDCIHTPGHAPDHICYRLREEKALFSGDHVMGWSTSVIVPPSGNMEDYMNSLDLLLHRDDEIYWPAHGPSIEDPKPYVRTFVEHRIEREDQILEALSCGQETIEAMVPGMYHNVPEILHPAAARSVLAAMIYLIKKGKVLCDGEPSLGTKYRLP
ncbi:MAG: MBL fold metallo-hydrolase [Proteobacteria bacterium]|nr:MBL fold metallo-hydrolase [Pseudomonadota bacterium]